VKGRATRTAAAGARLLPALLALFGSGATAAAQEGPAGTDAVPVDVALRDALRELRQGKDVDANLARVRAAIGQAKDRGSAALALGIELLRAGLYEAAQGLFEMARAERPQDGTVAQMLGLSFVMQNRFAEAIDPLRAAEKQMPPGLHPYLWQYQSMALAGLQHVDDAVALAKRAIDEAHQWNARLQPGQAPLNELDLQLNLEAIYERTNRHAESLAVLDALPAEKLSRKELAKAMLARAKLLAAKGDDAGALEAFRRHVALAGDAAEGWYQLGLFHLARNEPEQAKEPLQKAVALDAHHEGAAINLARVLLRLGEAEAGRKMMESYRSIRAERIASEVRLLKIRNELIEGARAAGH
jgi:tetratricopeptide (TPR) repeat protein